MLTLSYILNLPILRQQMLVEVMQQQFLAGSDPGVDYAAIDADAELDEHWQAEKAQDAEDAYFDGQD